MQGKFFPSLGIGILLAATLATGCSDDKHGNNDTDTGIPLADVSSEIAKTNCHTGIRCAGSFFALQGLSEEDCIDATTKSFENGFIPMLEAAIDDGRVSYDGLKAKECLDAMNSATCEELARGDQDEVCAQVTVGKIELGGDCTFSDECAGDNTFCYIADQCPGTCTELIPEGGDCSQEGAVCESELQCLDGKCVKPASVGEACSHTDGPNCDDFLFCVGADDQAGQPGTCKTMDEVFVAQEGASCDMDGLLLCAEGLSCTLHLEEQTASFSCVEPVAADEECAFAIPSQCPAGYYCDVDLQANKFTGHCVQLPGIDEACVDQMLTPACAWPARCVNGKCKQPVANGEACTADEECYSDNCSDGKCAPSDPCKRIESEENTI